MKVPIYSRDLEAGKGVLLLAGILKRDWPGSRSISISTAQNLISRCLGYSCLRDLRESLATTFEWPPSPSSLASRYHTIIKSELQAKEPSMKIDISDYSKKIQKLSLQHLTAYRHSFGFLGVRLSKEDFLKAEEAIAHHQQPEVLKKAENEQQHSQNQLSPMAVKRYIDALMGQCRFEKFQSQEILPKDCIDCLPIFFK